MDMLRRLISCIIIIIIIYKVVTLEALVSVNYVC